VIQLAEVQTVRDLVLLQLEGMKQSGRIVSYKPPTIDRKYLEVIVVVPFATYQAKAPWGHAGRTRALEYQTCGGTSLCGCGFAKLI
jgi:hypothetical protein